MKKYFFFFFSICFNLALFSQENKPIFLKNADNLIGSVVDGEQVRDLVGNVELVQGNLTLKCVKARQYFATNKIEVSGKVIITQDTLKLYTDEGIYFANTRTAQCKNGVKVTDGHVSIRSIHGFYDANSRKAVFFNSVELFDPTYSIYSDSLVFFRNEKKLFATKNVLLKTKDNNTFIMGDSLEYHQLTRYTKVYPESKLFRVDTVRTKIGKTDTLVFDTLFLKTKILESRKDSVGTVIIATDSVKLFRNDVSAACKSLLYYNKDSLFVLNGDPVLWYQNSQLFADSIKLLMKNSSLEKIFAKGNAFILAKDSIYINRFDQIMGESIFILFKEKRMDSIISSNQAMALYYLYDNDKPNGANKSSGDKIIMIFNDGKILDVKVINGIEGNYFPENMIKSKEMNYNLEHFKVFHNKPKRSEF